ncbi:hypothetical protein [Aeromonas caviae]|uniref:hypothetical protein n=1 Tax=Aeromonas caviae TaxID=648 RepID=UPI002B490A38|nr:hypothetical protein [Aeromonas caviae]
MKKTKKIDIQILTDGDELISSVCQNDTITLTVKKNDGRYKIFLVEKNNNGLFKLKFDYEISVSEEKGTPLVKTSFDDDDSKDSGNSVRAYTL